MGAAGVRSVRCLGVLPNCGGQVEQLPNVYPTNQRLRISEVRFNTFGVHYAVYFLLPNVPLLPTGVKGGIVGERWEAWELGMVAGESCGVKSEVLARSCFESFRERVLLRFERPGGRASSETADQFRCSFARHCARKLRWRTWLNTKRFQRLSQPYGRVRLQFDGHALQVQTSHALRS